MPVDINGVVISGINLSSRLTSYFSHGLLSTPTLPIGRVESIQLPGITIDTEGRFGAATKTHYPRWLETESTQITFYEDANYNTLLYLRSWREMIVDRQHNYYPSANYKRTIFFMGFDLLSNTEPTLIGEIMGAFPTNGGAGIQWEYTASGMVTVPCQFSVDDVELHFNSQTQ